MHRDITLYLWGTAIYKGLPIYVGVALYIYLVGSVVFHRRAALLSKASDDGLCMCKHVHISYMCVSVYTYMYDVAGDDLTIEVMNLGLLKLLTFKIYGASG